MGNIRFKTREDVIYYLVCEGFHKFEESENEISFHKLYNDRYGTKYLLIATVTENISSGKTLYKYVVQYGGRFYDADNRDFIDIEFIEWDLKKVERWLDKLINNKLLDYYEYDKI